MSLDREFDVIVCGSLHLDIVVNAPALPRLDETAVGHSWQQVCGGKGGNQAVQAANAKARTAMLGRVGDDEFGRTLLSNLEASNVDVTGIVVDRAIGSGMSVAILQDNGDYGAVIVSGANLGIDAERLAEHWVKLGGAKVLVLQNEVPHHVNVAAARLARNANALVILNAAPARPVNHDLLDNVDVLVVNRVEAEAMWGKVVSSRADAKSILSQLENETRNVVVTLGGEGLVLLDDRRNITEIEPIKVNVTSTHGAGDCFIGVLAAELAAGRSLSESCSSANMKAAAFVSRIP